MPAQAINAINQLEAQFVDNQGLSPGQRRAFCALGDRIDHEQGVAMDAGDTALAARWQAAYDTWQKLYRAIQGDGPAIDAALPGQRVRECCARGGPGVRGDNVL